MRRSLLSAGLLALCQVWACGARAQGYGLGIAELADAPAQGLVRTTGGAVLGADITFVGVRGTYAPATGLGVFADAGFVDVDGFDLGLGIQFGALCALPLELPVPVAVALRGTVYTAFVENLGVLGLHAGGVASYGLEQVLAGLSVYGGLGISYTRWRLERVRGDIDDADSDLALSLGALYAASERLSFFAELGHAGDMHVGLGCRFDL